MTERAALQQEFLAQAGWQAATQTPLAGDASARRYLRLRDGGRKAVLMDCPADAGDIAPFLSVADHLRRIGLSAPEIFAADAATGFILMEDLGDTLFARGIADGDLDEQQAYEVAVDVLVRLHQQPLPDGLVAYGPTMMAEFIHPAFDWYCPEPHRDESDTIVAGLETILNDHAPDTDVMILRDYHAENLLWLPDRDGIRRAGVLDFQDALAGHRAYDLVSLLQDARRDVSEDCAAAMVQRYVAQAGLDAGAFSAACAAQAAQRNLRILGIFARLSRQAGKTHYIDLVPRVWSHLLRNLAHPVMADLRPLVLQSLPAPGTEHLNWLKSP